ncbi:protein of unknown function [Lutibacter oricola]|uniref:DUF4286 domain-containing protein n=1 Tax=Lutibacter oricola TaxID=762486 RepID=A0A1H2RR56_9FLAO|nr:DUF4286 family protein [Lutibacter oricola]SDW21807.1 protein of unknown function [Lutibacter oricola]
MYIYNVTTNVDESIHQQWLNWMKTKHIPDMLATEKFTKAKMCKVLINEEMGGVTYSVQYTTDNEDMLESYYTENAPKLRNEAKQLFGEKILSFRTELQVISEQFSMSLKN